MNKSNAINVLRIYVGLTMVIHGIARIIAGGVGPFGEFLGGSGFVLGLYLAWAITIFEIAGGSVLMAGYFTPYLSLIFAGELVAGIVLVHAANGWFVVGLGRNGMEYSVLLIVVFVSLAIDGWGTRSNG